MSGPAPTEFDRYRDTYEAAVDDAIGFAGQEHAFYVEAKARRLLDLTRRVLGREDVAALDVGCGPGLTDELVLPHVRSLAGVDVSAPMVERARAANPDATYEVYDGRRLPYDEASFDVVFAICVLHHVEPPDRAGLVRELARVTRPGGLVAVFEHNPVNPLTRRVVRECEFDEGVELLGRRELEGLVADAGLAHAATEYLLFFPWRGRAFSALERALRPVPLGAQYVVAGRPSG